MNEELSFQQPYLFPPLHVLICAKGFKFIIVISEPRSRVSSSKKKNRRQYFFVLLIFFIALNNNFIQPAVLHFDGHYDHQSMLMENFSCFKEYQPLIEPRTKQPNVGTILTYAQQRELEAKHLKDLKLKNYLF